MAAAGAPLWQQQQQQQQQHRRSCSSSSCDIVRSCSGSSCSANCSMSSCCSSSSANLKCSSRELPCSAGSAGSGLAVAAVAAAAGVAAGPTGVWMQQQQHQLSTASPFCSMAHQLQQLPGEQQPAAGLSWLLHCGYYLHCACTSVLSAGMYITTLLCVLSLSCHCRPSFAQPKQPRHTAR
jgi:hypothetical protein